MKSKRWERLRFILSVLPALGIMTGTLISQEVETKPVVVGQPMIDFTLSSLQGETVTLSKLRGKNVLILFPRGYAAENYWCTICSYKYAELIDLESEGQIRARKNPTDPDKLDEKGKRGMELYKMLFPKDLVMKTDDIPMPFPILVDAGGKLSRSLGIFSQDWDGSKVDQNMPSVYLVDANGTLVFKYIGQNTFDRPDYSYLLNILEFVNSL